MHIHLEDQYLTCSAHTPLSEIHAASSAASEFLGLRAARVPLPLGQLLARGGFGELRHPLRHEVLGMTYRSSAGPVEIGGTVVKNVAGYDLTRLLIGAGVDCFVSAHLRLRSLGQVVVYALTHPEAYPTLREHGWDFAWSADGVMYVQGNATLEPPAGASAVERPPLATRWSDERGPLEQIPTWDPLERQILQSLELVAVQ